MLGLTGCFSAYHPDLAVPAKDQSKYESDRQECISTAQYKLRHPSNEDTARSAVGGAFGLVGAGIMAVTSDSNSDYNKSGYEMVDECMAKKGYKLAN